MEIMTSSMLRQVLDEPKQKVSYNPNEKLTVDVDLSLCSDEEMPRMIHIVNRLAKSEAGRETLEIANKAGVKFGFLDAKTNCFGCYFGGDMKCIGLGPMASDDKLVSTLCHESRHAGQAERMADLPDRNRLNVASIVRYSRAKEADAQAYAVKACKELEMQGDTGPLATFAKFYPPIYKAYETAIAKEGVMNDKVVSDVFKGWYDQTRTKQNYEEGYIIEPMHDAIKQNFTAGKGKDVYTFAENVGSKTVVEKIGWTKNGNYLSAENPDFLDEPRFAAVGERTKTDAQAFFQIRKERAGIEPDKSVDALPTNKDAFERRLPEMGQPRGNVGETMNMGNTIERWKNIQAQRKLKGMLGTLGQAFEPPGGKKEYPDEKPAVDVDLRYCAKKDRPRMIALINRLARSKVGLETLQIAADNGFHFNFIKGSHRAFGFADPEHKRIALNPKFTDSKLVGTMCHECRHAGQFMRASNLEENRWDVKTNLIYMRAMEADAQAYAATACEEMFRLGDPAPKQDFYKYYPPIAEGFTKALIKNDAQLGDQLLTDTFKSWYDQQGTKTVYEANYLLEPMQQDLRDIANGKDKEHQMSFDMSISAQKTIAEIAWTKHGNYFKDDPEILNGGKYLDVCDYTMAQMKKYFEIRKEMTGKDDSKALDGIPTRADTIPARTKGMKKPAAKKSKTSAEKNITALLRRGLGR